MLFLVWYDANTQRPAVERMQDALAAYTRRFSTVPNLVLVSIDESVELVGVEVRSVRTVQPHQFWVGRSEDQSLAQGVEEGEIVYG